MKNSIFAPINTIPKSEIKDDLEEAIYLMNMSNISVATISEVCKERNWSVVCADGLVSEVVCE